MKHMPDNISKSIICEGFMLGRILELAYIFNYRIACIFGCRLFLYNRKPVSRY
jgi:hypothetical protein